MTGFKGQVALVTGAGGGLGRSHALGLAARGVKVAVCDISIDAAESVAMEIRALGCEALAFATDVADLAAVTAMVDEILAHWQQIHILVNNAGILRDRSFSKMTPEEFRDVLDVHLTGSFNCSKAVWNQMRSNGYGRILFTSSASGIFGNFGQANYGAAKAGMIGLMNVLDIEGEKYGICVNALAPSAATRMTNGLISDEAATLLEPEKVTPAVLYLVGPNAPSRLVMGAGAGVYSVIHIHETAGIYLPENERSPEGIAARMAEIADPEGEATYKGAFEQTRRFIAKALKDQNAL